MTEERGSAAPAGAGGSAASAGVQGSTAPAKEPAAAPAGVREAESLADRFDALGRCVRIVREHVRPAGAPADVALSTVDAAGELSKRAAARLRLRADHTVVALAGATGSGKSSLFNALARMPLSAAGHLRPTTAAAHACVWGRDDADALLDWLGVVHRFRRESALDAHDEESLHGLVLLDLPDLDSVATGHRLEADRLVGVVDVVVWVLDPQKYADQTVHEEYLSRMAPLHDVTVVVFNQTDLLSPDDTQRCLVDLTRLVETDGLPGVPVLATSARTGSGVNELRTLLEKAVAGRHAALARLEGELDEAVDELIPLVRTQPADDPLDRAAMAAFADELAAAAGVPAVAADAGRAYVRRSTVPGPLWPRRRVAADRQVPPADPAAVAVAARRLAATAGEGLPAPWPDEIVSVVNARAARIPEELGETLTRMMPPPPRRTGWLVARAVWWLAVAAAVAGVAWLAWRGLSLNPLALTAAGVVVAVLLPVLSRPLARMGGRRHAARVRRQLDEGTADLARESVAPARAVLLDYGTARAALQAATGRSAAVPAH